MKHLVVPYAILSIHRTPVFVEKVSVIDLAIPL